MSSSLRNRKGKLSALDEGQQSVTELPVMEESDGTPHLDFTPIPTAEGTKETASLTSSSGSLSEVGDTTKTKTKNSLLSTNPRSAMTGDQVAKDETRGRKILVRVISGTGMISIFFLCIYLGHLYVCMLVALSEFLLFRELVKVRYNAHFHTIEDTIPLFRTTQWMWFVVAIFYAYGDFLVEVIQNNSQLHYLGYYAEYFSTLAFVLYSATFVMTIATMQVGHIKFQLNQLCWSIVVLCLTVGQMKYIMHNIFNGLFWFTFPFLLVVTNDIMAYFSGMTCGRKFISRQFISFSPNKTWEGFIGGGIFTMVTAWYLSRALAQYQWMTCPANEFRLISVWIECETHHVFQMAKTNFSPQVFEVFPSWLVKMIPGIVEICSVKDYSIEASTTTLTLTPCISGEATHLFHHFELILKNLFPIQIHALWLAFFASVVGPFGGFLASAIKRAYGIKDFDSLIPGHGGVMDRLDCQFLMALCTWVHFNSFVKLATVSVPKLVYMYQMLSDVEKQAFLEEITKGANKLPIRKRLEEYAMR